jgi:hypothetical protein
MNATFDLPTKERFAELCKDLNLDKEQAHELELAIRHAHEDLDGFFKTRISRAERAYRFEQLKAFDKALTKLIATMGPNTKAVADFNVSLPFSLREQIGLMASPSHITTATGRTARKSRAARDRKVAGLEHGAKLLHVQLTEIKKGIGNLLESAVIDRGGRSPDLVRQYLVKALAQSASDILGRAATSTSNSRFVQLVLSVFSACAIDEAGAEELIERSLKTLRSKK